MRWARQRVSAVHPGTDAIIRVVLVRTVNGVIRSAVITVSPFPDESSFVLYSVLKLEVLNFNIIIFVSMYIF